MSFIFSSNPNAESAPTPLPPALLLIISTPDMLWTPPDFGKQFMSTISADYPISPQNNYIKQDNSTTFPFVIKLDYQHCQQQNPLFVAFLAKYLLLGHRQQCYMFSK